ncbi:MAG: hypothetical protein HC840_23135, partial [Leptolyngbyaceae cyanobacterium RM2_2_4]|nr:hypothetical protein [Leptolyngbyaceae cyanobacterium RM2_2_4]
LEEAYRVAELLFPETADRPNIFCDRPQPLSQPHRGNHGKRSNSHCRQLAH